MQLKYFIKTFGCQENVADSERVASYLEARGMRAAKSYQDANYIVVNTCMVRQSAENRVYGLINNLAKIKKKKLAKNRVYKIILTGCMVGVAVREKSGQYLKRLKEIRPAVDEFMPIEEVGFDLAPLLYRSLQPGSRNKPPLSKHNYRMSAVEKERLQKSYLTRPKCQFIWQ